MTASEASPDPHRAAGRVHEALAAWFPGLPAVPDAGGLPDVDDGFDLASLIDHTLLVPTATDADVQRLCEDAQRHGFHAVCVHGARLPAALEVCRGSPVAVACVIDFPLGAASTDARANQAASAVTGGAQELDLVAPAGVLEAALPGGESPSWDGALLEGWVADVAAVTKAARSAGACQLKLILETDRLTAVQTVVGALLAEHAGVDFVKTSTGFGKGGASREAIGLMHAAVGGRLGIKASGGIRTRADALTLVRAGATRLGTSGSVALVQDGS